MRDFLDFLKVTVTFILLVCLPIAAIIGGVAYGIERPSCYAHWGDSGMLVRWSLWGDCQLRQADGSWITDDAYLALNKNISVKP